MCEGRSLVDGAIINKLHEIQLHNLLSKVSKLVASAQWPLLGVRGSRDCWNGWPRVPFMVRKLSGIGHLCLIWITKVQLLRISLHWTGYFQHFSAVWRHLLLSFVNTLIEVCEPWWAVHAKRTLMLLRRTYIDHTKLSKHASIDPSRCAIYWLFKRLQWLYNIYVHRFFWYIVYTYNIYVCFFRICLVWFPITTLATN